MAAVLLFEGCTTVHGIPSPPDRALLVGAWSLVSAIQVRANGTTAPSRVVDGAEHASGSLVYSSEGTVSVQIAGGPRPTFVRNAEAPAPDAAVGASLLSTYYAYFGRYEVDAKNGTVKHFVTTSLFSGENGRTYDRRYTIEGDRLTLDTAPTLVGRERVFNRLIWRRVPAQAAP
jgi:hypothetical protein